MASNELGDNNGGGGWTESQRLEVQRRAQSILQEWHDKVELLRGEEKDEDVQYFRHLGFLRVANFSDATEVKHMKREMQLLVRDHWDPQSTTSEHSFATDDRANEERGDYFLDSADRVHFFVEPAALEATTGKLKPQYQNTTSNGDDDADSNIDQRLAALNKVGHGLHVKNDTIFHTYATSSKLQDLVHRLGWIDPVIPQSMYIFKQAQIGGAVNSHQDATFLFTTPRQTCLGCWLALDDATLENGCLWVRPQSHQEPVRRQFVRNPDYFGDKVLERRQNVPQGDLTLQKLVMKSLEDDGSEEGSSSSSSSSTTKSVPWDGSLPEPWHPSSACSGLFEAGFVPIECKAGDLLVFYGTLDHLSLPNESSAPRHTFQLHLVDGPGAGITWSKSNWLQYPEGVSFMSIAKPIATFGDDDDGEASN